MAKAKKQKNKAETRILKSQFDKEHSLSDHDAGSRKNSKKSAKKLRHTLEEKYFSKE